MVDSVLKVCIVTISDHFSSSHSLYLSISLRLPLTGMGCFLQYVPRPYEARPMRFGSSGPKDFFSDTSPKCIDRERTGWKDTVQGLCKVVVFPKQKHDH